MRTDATQSRPYPVPASQQFTMPAVPRFEIWERLPFPDFKPIPKVTLASLLRRNQFRKITLPIRREETVAIEVAVDARDEQTFAERHPFGVDAFPAGDPGRAGPLIHPLGDDDGLGQGGRPLGAGEGLGRIARDNHRPATRQRLTQFDVTGRPFDHDTPSGLVHEPGQVLGNMPRKPAARADDPVAGHGDDAMEGFWHGPKGC